MTTFDEVNERDGWRALLWIIRAADLYFSDPRGPGSRPKWRIVDGRPETYPIREFRAGVMAAELRTWAESVRTVHPELGLPDLPASIGADEDIKLIGLWARTRLMEIDGAGRLPPPGEPVRKLHDPGDKPPRLTAEAKALAVLYQHSDWTDSEIAAEARIARTTLYKSAKFKAVRDLLRESGKHDLPRGAKDGQTGDLEAWE